MAKKKKGPYIPTVKDDGSRWVVKHTDHLGRAVQVYPGKGLMKSEALRLNEGLATQGWIEQV